MRAAEVKSDSQSLCHTGPFGLLLHSFILPLTSRKSLTLRYWTRGKLLAVPCHKTIEYKQKITVISKAVET